MDFQSFWSLIENHGSVAGFYKAECADMWRNFSPEQQEAIVRAIDFKLRTGRFVHFNPVMAIKDNLPKPPRRIVLSSDEYYTRYRTTEPTDGFQKIHLPEQQKTIYVKQ